MLPNLHLIHRSYSYYNAKQKIKPSRLILFGLHKKWLGKIKQALTTYKEDIRQRLEDFNPED